MTPDAPKYETIEHLDIGDVKDSDEVVTVRFECGAPFEGGICGQSVDTYLLDRASAALVAFSWDKCHKCGQYSGFQLPENKKADTVEKRDRLSDVLRAENLRYPTANTRREIQWLLEGRNLRLRFKVKRPAA